MQFVMLPMEVLADPTLSAATKLVYAYLRDRQGGNGHAWPGVRVISEACGLGLGTVHTAIRRLEAAGLITVERVNGAHRGRTNCYAVAGAGEPTKLHVSKTEREITKNRTVAVRKLERSVSEHLQKPNACVRNLKFGDSKNRTDSDSLIHTQPDSVVSRPDAARRSRPNAAVLWCAESGWSGITEQDRAGWVVAYPAVDIDQELARATVWLRANPTKAGKRNWRRFLANWFSRTQDRGGTVCAAPRGSQAASRASVEDDWHADIGHVRPEVFEA